MSEVLVSYNLARPHRGVLNAVLSGAANITFLDEVPAREREPVIRRTEVLITWSPVGEFSFQELATFERLRLVQLFTAGAEHVPFAALPPGVLIASNPGAFAEPMAEHILGMALALAKRLCFQNAKLKQGIFDQATKNRSLRGLSFGVLGFGGIGKAAARLMRGLGLKIFGINTSGRTDEPVDFIGKMSDLDFLLKESDILLVSIPLTVRTKGLIGPRELALMKPDAVLINVARGAILDEKALYEHLVRNPEFCAGIDAWWVEPSMGGRFTVDYPFFDLPNFLGSPHNSSITPGTMSNAVRLASENVAEFLKTGNLRGEIKRGDYLELK